MQILYDHYIFGSNIFTFSYLDSMRMVAAKNKDEGLMWESRIFEVCVYYHCYQKKETCPEDTVIRVMERLLEDARKHNKRWLVVRAHGALGALYFNKVKDNEMGIEHFVRTIELLDGVSIEEFPHKTACIYKLGIMYYKFQDYARAKKYLFDVLRAGGETDGDEFFRFQALNTLGLCYQQSKQLDSSDYCFGINLKRSQIIEHEARIGLTMGNMGMNQFLRKNYDKAIPLLKEDLRISLKIHNLGMASNAACLLGEIALKQNNLNEAWIYLYEAKDLAYRKPDDFGRFEGIFAQLAKLEAKLGHPDLAAMYLDSAIIMRDSSASAFNTLKMNKVEQRIELEKMNKTLVKATDQRNLLILSLSMAGIISAMLFGGFQLASRNEKQRLTTMKEQAEMELREAELQLNDFMESFKTKSDLLEQTRTELEELKLNAVPEVEKEEFLEQLQSSVILTEQDWREFQDLFEKVHIGFFARLRDKIPGLTQSETRFLSLKRLRLSNKEMASMLGVSVSTIRSLQSRLMPKISLDEAQSLEDFVEIV